MSRVHLAFIGPVSKPAQIPITELKKGIISTWKDVTHLGDIFDHRRMIIPPKTTVLLTHIRFWFNILNNSSSCFELNATNKHTFNIVLYSSEGDSQQLQKVTVEAQTTKTEQNRKNPEEKRGRMTHTGVDHCLGLLRGARRNVGQSPGRLKLERRAAGERHR